MIIDLFLKRAQHDDEMMFIYGMLETLADAIYGHVIYLSEVLATTYGVSIPLDPNEEERVRTYVYEINIDYDTMSVCSDYLVERNMLSDHYINIVRRQPQVIEQVKQEVMQTSGQEFVEELAELKGVIQYYLAPIFRGLSEIDYELTPQ